MTGAGCKAVCVVVSENGNNVLGPLTMSQSDLTAPVKITGTLTGLTPGKHGLSICSSGDLSKGAASCGPIFNPFGTLGLHSRLKLVVESLVLICRTHTASKQPFTGKSHGSPTETERMMGDLGNILANENGAAAVNIVNPQLHLLGPHSVVGRSVVVYAGEDDQGRGGHETSTTTGNPGPRIAAGVIGISLS